MRIKVSVLLRAIIFAVASGFVFPVLAAPADDNPQARVSHSVKHALSQPLREIAKDIKPKAPRPPYEIPNEFEPEALDDVAPRPNQADPLWQSGKFPASRAPTPVLSFEGASADDDVAVAGGAVAPPDTNGDVGPNHYVQWVNLVIEIFDKSGNSVLGPIAGSDLWTGFGGVCETTNDGDPIVRYDQFADRWMLSQFAINDGVQCVAVSQTGDPTGAWHLYAFDVSTGLNDYPKLGVWPDGYYLTFNEFNGGFQNAVACALERDQMLIGGTAGQVCFPVPAAGGDTFFALQPATVEGLTAPPAGTPNPFVMAFDDEVWGGSPDPTQDFYKVWEFTADWTNPANSTFTGPVDVPTAEFDGNFCGFNPCIPQSGTGTLLDTLGQFTMFAAVYRNWDAGDGHVDGVFDALWISTSTDVTGADLAGVRWAELRDPTGTPVVHQAGTFAPADGLHRWMPSLSVDNAGNMLVGYSTSSSTTFPSIAWAGRLVSDPLGVLSQGEALVHAGTGSQTNPSRWGDYSSMSLDESDGCGFWYTTEYYDADGSFDWKTRIASTSFITCAASAVGTIAGIVTSDSNGNPIDGALITADDGVGGVFTTSTDVTGNYSLLAPAGTYDVTADAFGFASETVIGVIVTDASVTPVDFALTPAANIAVDGFVTDGSGASWPLYATVTYGIVGGGDGGPFTVYTDPDTGYYSLAGLVAGSDYNFHVEAVTPSGYVPEDRLVSTGVGDSQENFGLQVAIAGGMCQVPGYEYGVLATLLPEEQFEGATFPPTGWAIQDSSTGCDAGDPTGWSNLDTNSVGNLTGGGGLFAMVNADECGDGSFGNGTTMNADLDTAAFDASGFSSYTVQWNHDYRDLGSTAQVQAWDGSAWVTIADFSGSSDRGPALRTATTTVGAGLANAQIRFHYASAWDWWWEVDNVSVIAAGCNYTGGGLIVGNVSDGITGLAVNGADVSLDTGQATTTAATPDDPGLDDGFYTLFAPLTSTNAPGTRTITVESTGYGTQQRQSVPVPGGTKREDFVLQAGQLAATPPELRVRVAIAGTGQQTLTVNNNGTLDAAFTIYEQNFPAPPLAPIGGWPTEQGISPLQPEDSKLDYLVATQLTAQGVPDIVNPPLGRVINTVPTIKAAGGFVSSFASGLAFPDGIGWYPEINSVWLTNPAAGGGDDLCYEFQADGTPTGNTLNCLFDAGVFSADMAFNPTTGTFWVANVGGDNCLYEFDPATSTATGNTICGPWANSQRGVAYDPASDTYYTGNFFDTTIWQINPDGTLVRSLVSGLPVNGLAYNPLTQHLMVQTTAADGLVHVLDAVDPNLAEVGTFLPVDQNGDPIFVNFGGGGLAYNCSGSLVGPNFNDQIVYTFDDGEPDVLCDVDIPWFEESPTTATVLAGGSMDVLGNFDALNYAPSCPEAHIKLANDTPYGFIAVPVGMTVGFNDVVPGSLFDSFIHGMADAQIALGCGSGNFCPGDPVLRDVMALWLVRAGYGVGFAPPPATGLVFEDVAPNQFAADEIEFLASENVTAGCSVAPSLYCPQDSVNRAQMAVFLLKTVEGGSYAPPACTGLFADVACPSLFANWVEEIYNRGITAGCSSNPLSFCPNQVISRAEMSVFAVKAFELRTCPQ